MVPSRAGRFPLCLSSSSASSSACWCAHHRAGGLESRSSGRSSTRFRSARSSRNSRSRSPERAREMTWKPALVEIEEALVPAFIIEELDDAVAIRSSRLRCRHRLPAPGISSARSACIRVDVTFAQAIQTVTKWGSGSKELVAAMKRRPPSGGPRCAYSVRVGKKPQCARAVRFRSSSVR